MKAPRCVLMLLLSSGLLLTGCSRQKGPDGVAARKSRPAPTVSLATSKSGTLPEYLEVAGHLEAVEQAELSSKLTRRVERVGVREGDTVAAGEVVIWLDRQDLDAQVGQANAALEAAQATVVRAQANLPLTEADVAVGIERARQTLIQAQAGRMRAEHELEDANHDFQRKQQLFSEDAIPKTQLEQAQLRYRFARRGLDQARSQEKAAAEGVRLAMANRGRNTASSAEVVVAQAGVSQSRANLEAAEVQDSYAAVRSPISGVVVERKVDPGQVVGPQQGTLMRIVNNGELELYGPVPERYLPFLKPGLPVELTSQLESKRVLQARLHQVVPASDPATHTVKIRIRVRDPLHRLISGVYVQARLKAREHTGVLVPRTAIQTTREGKYVLRREGDVARRVKVTVSYETDSEAVITEGLQAGVEVITAGGEGLADNAPIKVENGDGA